MSDEHERAAELLDHWLALHPGEEAPGEGWISAQGELAGALRRAVAAIRGVDGLADEGVECGEPPQRIGEYRVLREIGRGGMGVVYEAEQAAMHRRIALKVLYPSITNTSQAVERFQREARAAGSLKHTNIVTVHQLGEDKGVWYCAMELVDGWSLDKVLEDVRRLRPSARAKSSPGARTREVGESSGAADAWRATTGERRYFQRVAEMCAEIADALHLAHEEGVVHRDVKPANLMVSANGQLKILDFGLARMRDESLGLTVTGGVVGTPSYMSPEQARSAPVDARTDVYSLGATLYEILTLRPPFHAKGVAELLQKLRAEEPRAPSRVDRRIPRDLETIVLKALEKDPAQRYASAKDMARDLRAFADGTTIAARRMGPLTRGWRWVRRNRLRAAAAAVVLVSVAVAGTLAVMFRTERDLRHQEERRTKEREYLEICAAAAEERLRRSEPTEGPEASALYTEAIALLPDRYEAYLGRSNCYDRTNEMSLADLDAAAERGAPPRPVHLGRAYVLRDLERDAEADAEEARANAIPVHDALSKFHEAQIAIQKDERDRAVPLLDEVISTADRSSPVRYLARRLRAGLLERRLDFDGALADLQALRNAGDRTVPVAARTARAWRKVGQPAQADAIVDELIAAAQSAGTLKAWLDLTGYLRVVDETSAVDRAAGIGLDAFPGSTELMVRRAWALQRAYRLDEALALMQSAVRLAPDGHEELGSYGRLLADLARPAEAIEPLTRATNIAPKCPSCPTNLSLALRALHRPAEARDWAVEALRRDPDHYQARNLLGGVLLDAERYEEAGREFETVLRAWPRNVEALAGRAGVLAHTGQLDRALATLEEALAVDPEDMRSLNDKGTYLHYAKRYDDALVAFEDALKVTSRRPHIAAITESRRGYTYYEMGRFEEAVAAMKRSDALHPDQWGNLLNLGMVYLQWDKPKEALETEDRAIAILGERPHPYPFVWKAGAHLYLRQHEEALRAADKAISLREDLAMAHWRRGQALKELGRSADAVAALRRSVEIEPFNCGYIATLGLALDAAGELDQAIAAYEDALAKGATSPLLFNSLSWHLATRPSSTPGDRIRAIALAERAVAAVPHEPGFWNTLGVVRCLAERWDGALEAVRKSMDLNGGGGAYDWFTAAVATAHLGDAAKAREWYDRAVAWTAAEGSDNPDLVFLRGEADRALGISPPR